MFELRWQTRPCDTCRDAEIEACEIKFLQYRQITFNVNPSGCVNILPVEWTEWQDVPDEINT